MLAIREEVTAALRERRPVFALESTLIAHGLPAPRNLEVALALEELARSLNVTPATVAILDGRLRVGRPASREIPATEVDGWVRAAGAEMEAAGIRGWDVTPVLLARLAELSGGATLVSNVGLLENNVRLGCAISTALVERLAERLAEPAR